VGFIPQSNFFRFLAQERDVYYEVGRRPKKLVKKLEKLVPTGREGDDPH